MTLTCEDLVSIHAEAWHRATVHPFLAGCQQGTITTGQFNTWLVQDYLFVKDFTRMVGKVLGSAPDHHLDLLLEGLTALRDELRWFQAKAQERGLTLDVPRQATCAHYSDLMAVLVLDPTPCRPRPSGPLRPPITRAGRPLAPCRPPTQSALTAGEILALRIMSTG